MQHLGAPDPVPVVLGREINNVVLLQVAKHVEIEIRQTCTMDKTMCNERVQYTLA